VLAKSGEYDIPDGKATVEKMIKVADLSRRASSTATFRP
jgi:cobaltochelatase CobS